MNKLPLLALAFAIWIAPTAPRAANRIVSVEIAVEASTDMTTLPQNNTGAVILACGTCKARSYRVTPQTTYFVGSDSVTLAQLNSFVASGGTRGMTVFIEPDGSTVTRILVFGQLSAAKRK